VQKKVIKENHTLPHGLTASLRYSAQRAAIETRPNKPHKKWLVAELKQPIAYYSLYTCVAQRSAKGKVETLAQLSF